VLTILFLLLLYFYFLFLFLFYFILKQVHPDAACENLDVLVLGGAAIPVLHLKGEAIERSSPEATAAALTFMPGDVNVPDDPFAAESQSRSNEFNEFRGPSKANTRMGSRRHKTEGRLEGSGGGGGGGGSRNHGSSSKVGRFYAESSGVSGGLVDGVNAVTGAKGGTLNNGTGVGDLSKLENNSYLDGNFREITFGPLGDEEFVRKSDVRDRLKERLARGPMLKNKQYPPTSDTMGVEKGKAIQRINMSLQGTVISVEDAIVIAALVEENDKIDSLHLNSHRALPIKKLRGDDGKNGEVYTIYNNTHTFCLIVHACAGHLFFFFFQFNSVQFNSIIIIIFFNELFTSATYLYAF
jgi:hypothetical protein